MERGLNRALTATLTKVTTARKLILSRQCTISFTNHFIPFREFLFSSSQLMVINKVRVRSNVIPSNL